LGPTIFGKSCLIFIEQGKIIPVIGEHAVTFGEGNEPLYPWLARELANGLGVNGTRLAVLPVAGGVSVATSHCWKTLVFRQCNAAFWSDPRWR
jgi:hypothetical protein